MFSFGKIHIYEVEGDLFFVENDCDELGRRRPSATSVEFENHNDQSESTYCGELKLF